MSLIKGIVSLDTYSKSGSLITHREQPMRSFVKNFLVMLYPRFSGTAVSVKDYANASRTLGNDNWNWGMDFSGGGLFRNTNLVNDTLTPSCEWGGIQVGLGSTGVTPTDYKMENRVWHGAFYKSGTKANFTNNSFETGNLTGWTEAHDNANYTIGVANSGMTYKDGTYNMGATVTASPATAGWKTSITQDIDLTSVTHISFRAEFYAASFRNRLKVYVGATVVFDYGSLASWAGVNEYTVDVSAFTGTQTIKFEFELLTNYAGGAGQMVYVDNIVTYNFAGMWHGGMELIAHAYADPDGSFTFRKYFTNNSGSSITLNEIGLNTMVINSGVGDAFPTLLARDIIGGGQVVANNEILDARYTLGITV